MKAFGWIMIVLWIFGSLALLGNLFSGISADPYTDLLGIAAGVAQIIFNYKAIQKYEK